MTTHTPPPSLSSSSSPAVRRFERMVAYARDLEALQARGARIDVELEVLEADSARLTDAQRQQRLARLEARAQDAGQLQQSAVTADMERGIITPEHRDRALAYCRKHGGSFNDAMRPTVQQ